MKDIWKGRIALIIHFIALTALAIKAGVSVALTMSILSIGSLLFIYYPQEINQITKGMGGMRGPRINTDTPGCMIQMMGWMGTFALVFIVIKVLTQAKP